LKQKFFLTCAAALACASSFRAVAAPAEEKNWSFDVAPYLWIANVELETSLPSSSSRSVSEGFDTKISAGAMLATHVRYRSFGLFADFAWLRLDTEAENPRPEYEDVSLVSDFIHGTAALSYRFPFEGKFQLEALAGARIWYVANDLEGTAGTQPGFEGSVNKTWADPVIGASVAYRFTKHWSLDAKGFIGGFGATADIAGEVFAGVSYHFTDLFSMSLGYRYLHEEYDRSIKFDLNAQGFLLGVGFHF
jgi:opacity protein-like surface antigen